jgi:hypothetical protein
MAVSYPIAAPVAGQKLREGFLADLKDAANDHQTRVTVLEGVQAWNLITPLNSWTNAGGTTALLAYRRVASLSTAIQIVGCLNVGTTTNGITIGNIPAPDRPTKSVAAVVSGNGSSTTATPEVELNASGDLRCWNFASGLIIKINAIIPLDAL